MSAINVDKGRVFVRISPSFYLHHYGFELLLSNGERLFKLTESQSDFILNAIKNGICGDHRFEKLLEELRKIGAISLSSEPEKVLLTGMRGSYYPLGISLELTDCCNLLCKHCYKNASIINKHDMNYKIIESISTLLKSKIRNVLLTGGEPTIHPQFNEIIIHLSKNFDLRMFTNGVLIKTIDPEILKLISYIRVSVYGYDRDSYQNFTGHNKFDDVLEGLHKLNNYDIEYELLMVINDGLLDQFHKIVRRMFSYNPKKISFLFPMNIGRGSEIHYDIGAYRDRIEDLVSKSEYKDRIMIEDEDSSKSCTAGWLSVCISEEGMIRPCHILPQDIFNMGDYNDLDTYAESPHEVDENKLKRYVIQNPQFIKEDCINCVCVKKMLEKMGD